MNDTLPPVAWIDLETTGLSPDATVIEVSVVITGQGPEFRTLDAFLGIISPEGEIKWDDVAKQMAEKNGLLRDISIVGESPERVEMRLWNFWDRWQKQAGGRPIVPAGSGIHFDIPFIAREWPWLAKDLAYYHYDVGSLRRFARMRGVHANIDQANTPHRAMDDIFQHIREARILLGRIS